MWKSYVWRKLYVELEENGLAISVEVIHYNIRNFSIVTCCSALFINLWDMGCFVPDITHNTLFINFI
jgi:hypothetical protein